MPWAGRVPDRWRTVRAKWLFAKLDRPVRPRDEVVTCFRDGTVTLRKNRRELGYTESLKEIGYQGVRRGDLVIHAMDAFAGACGVSDSEGKSTPVYSVCAPRDDKANSHYYAFCVREMARSRWIVALAKGVRERSTDFRFSTFGDQIVPVPSSLEQAAIVRFLNHADCCIRRYIQGKEQLIKLLAEQRRAIIYQGATGQIDVRTGQPYPAYRDSGVEWLGKVPKHWQVTRVKTEFHCLNQRRVPLSSTERGTMTRRDYDYYGASGVIDKVNDYLFDDELLLIAEDGANLLLRNLPLAIIARGKFWVNNHAHILKPKRGHIEFLASAMESLSYLPWLSGATQPKLTQDRLMSVAIAVPPRHEQDQIVKSMAETTLGVDAAAREAREQIDLLREYRTRLIADVVTGKLDVRAAAAQLPEVEPVSTGDRWGTSDTESNVHACEHETAKEASA